MEVERVAQEALEIQRARAQAYEEILGLGDMEEVCVTAFHESGLKGVKEVIRKEVGRLHASLMKEMCQ